MFQHAAASPKPIDAQRSQLSHAFDGFPLMGTIGTPWSADWMSDHGHTADKAPHVTRSIETLDSRERVID
jgi:hypothetical protein